MDGGKKILEHFVLLPIFFSNDAVFIPSSSKGVGYITVFHGGLFLGGQHDSPHSLPLVLIRIYKG